MVTKLLDTSTDGVPGYILAKNHMVTKQMGQHVQFRAGYILAKNHMVTKPYVVPT